jgi:hypothetical protein
MKSRLILVIAVLAGAHALAAPIDFTTGIVTGARLTVGPDVFTDGLIITGVIQDYLTTNRPYSAQLVPTGSTNEINESFVQFQLLGNQGFSSAVGNGAGSLEVGVERNLFSNGENLVVSRWYTTIKNNTDEDVHFGLYLDFEEGRVEIKGTRFPSERSRAHIFAMVDYLLRTPDAGAYVDTTGRLYTYDVLLTNEGPNGTLVTSPTVEPLITDLSTASILAYRVEPFLLDLGAVVPAIPGRGELTIYYDMYAYFNNFGGENLGSAFIGDPLDLVQGGGLSLVPGSAEAVPEPATFFLCGAALCAVPLLRRIRRRKPGA